MHLNLSPAFPELLSWVHGKGDKETFAYAMLAAGEGFHT